jgi:hypothetical protein
VAVLALTAVTALAACSGGSKGSATGLTASAPASTSTASTSTLSTPAQTPSSILGYSPEDPGKIGSWVEFHGAVTGTTDEQAAITVWRKYLQFSAQAFNTQGLSLSTPQSGKVLDTMATGNGKTNVFAVVAARRKAGTFTVGRTIVRTATIKVTGATAVISACVDDQSYEVDQLGKTVTPAPGVEAFVSTMVRSSGTWKVSDSKLGAQTCPAVG